MRERAGRRAVAGAVLLVAGPVLLDGCGTGAGEQPAPDADVAVARYTPTGSGGDAALLRGVARVVDGCLVVEETGDGTVYTPILPDGMRAPAEGDVVALGGGAHDRWNGVGRTNGCDTAPFWMVAAG